MTNQHTDEMPQSGCAHNPPGYVDELGQKHEWTLEGDWVWHRIDGRTQGTQQVQGLLDYGIAELLHFERNKATRYQEALREARTAIKAADAVGSFRGYIGEMAQATMDKALATINKLLGEK